MRVHSPSTSILTALLFLAAGPLGRAHAADQLAVTTEEVRSIVKDAYIFGFPIVDNYRVLYSYFVDPSGKEFKGGWNRLHHETRVYTPEDRTIQTPNSDTPYSQLGTDLRAEPLVITVPEVEPSRYYSLQFIDAYTFNYAYVGSRTTGNGAGRVLLAGPRWKGDVPDGIEKVIHSETEFGWVLFRTQLFNPADIDAVKRVQAGFHVQPLSAYLGKPAESAPKVDFRKPLTPEQQRTSPEFFQVLNFVLQFCPVHPSEKGLMDRLAKVQIGAGKTFDVKTMTPEVKQAVELGMSDAWAEFATYKKTEIDTGKRTAADGFGTREFLKNDYLARMASAVLGIYGNSKEEALYPVYFVDSEGKKLDGGKRTYRLRFAADKLPPVKSFWSLTMYELPSSLLVANSQQRYLINSPMLPNLQRDQDGGLTILIQHDSPGREKESNWLPAPPGEFFMVMRLYWPQPAALSGEWKPPQLIPSPVK